MNHHSLFLAAAVLFCAATPSVGVAQACATEVVLKRLDAGTVGPELTTPDGAPAIGGPFSIQIENAFPNSSGALVFSTIEAPFFDPTYGAIFHFGVPFKTSFFTTDSEGNSPREVDLSVVVPSACGVSAIFQAGVFDPGAQNGIAVSNALRLVVGERVGRFFEPGIPAGQSGVDSVLGDLDGDGLRDLVTTDPLSVRLGLVGGGFAAGGFELPTSAVTVEMADLTGDGDQDVLTAGSGFTVYAGDGNGGFTGAASFAGDGARAVLDDFDLDGNLDVVLSGTSTSLYTGTGNGFFNFPVDFATGDSVDVECGDLNDDGFQDVVSVIRSTDRVLTMTGDGTGNFQLNGPFVVGTAPERVAIGDFDGDTLLDVVTANEFSRDITLRPGNGNGFLSPIAATVPTGKGVPSDLLATDLDADGDLDLAVVKDFVEDVSVMLGNGDGTFGNVEHLAGVHSASAVEATDYDLDGDLDLVLLGGTGHVVLHGDGTDRFSGVRHFDVGGVSPVFSSGVFEVLKADMNLDGVEDAVVRSDDDLHVLIGSRSGPVSNSGTTVGSNRAALGDFNGDGFQDVVLEDGSIQSEISVLLNGGDGTLGAPTSFMPANRAFGLFAEDVNGDLVSDLLLDHVSQLSVWIANGDGTFAGPALYAATGNFDQIELVDLNGNGSLDLAYVVDDMLFVRINAGNGTFGAEVAYSAVANVSGLTLVDVGGGSGLDFVYTTAGAAHVRINAGDGTFGSEDTYTVDGSEILTGDINVDLFTDLIVGTQALINQGNGTFALGISIGSSLDERRLVDVTSDGVVDFVGLEFMFDFGTNMWFAAIGVRVGRGDGTFEPKVTAQDTSTRGRNTAPLLIVDLDGDAVLDGVIVATDLGDVVVFPGNDDGTFGAPDSYYAGRELTPMVGGGLGTVETIDLDGDGIQDLFVTADDRVALLTNRLGE